jgi:hypothetical protein
VESIVGGVVTSSDAPIFEYLARVYYIRPCSRFATAATTCTAAADGGRPIPTLARQELNGATMVETPLVEGIERVFFLYGIDADGNGIPERFVPDPTAADWTNVVSVRVAVLARSPNMAPDTTTPPRPTIWTATARRFSAVPIFRRRPAVTNARSCPDFSDAQHRNAEGSMKRVPRYPNNTQRGAVLVVSLIMLAVMTLLVITMIKTAVLDLKIGGASQQAALNLANAEVAINTYLVGNPTFSLGCLVAPHPIDAPTDWEQWT